MPIYRAIQERSFAPDQIDVITRVFEDFCAQLNLAARDDPIRDLMAKIIIECADSGIFNETAIRDCVKERLAA